MRLNAAARRGALVLSVAASLLIAAAMARACRSPGLFGGGLDFLWINKFYREAAHPGRLLLSFAAFGASAFVFLLWGRARKFLDRPLVFALFFSAPFFILSFSRAHGDSQDWVDWIGRRYFMSEPGATLVHHLFYRALHSPFNLGARSVIALTSRCAGFATLWLIARLSHHLFEEPRGRALFRLVFFFSGPALLFYGYIENTPLLIPCEMLYLLCAARFLASDRAGDLACAALALALATVIHGSAAFLLPSLFFMLLMRHLTAFGRLAGRAALALLLYAAAIGLFLAWVFCIDKGGIVGPVYGNAMGGGDNSCFVPLRTVGGRATYLFFSRYHFHDILNILFMGASSHLLLAPVILAGQIPALRRGINPLLFGYLLSRLAFLSLWNCDFGFLLDWDLMVPNALPFLLIGAWALSREMTGRGAALAAAPVVLAGAIVTGALFCIVNGAPPATVLVPALPPLAGAGCAAEGLAAKYYREKSLSTPLAESATDFPQHAWDRSGPAAPVARPPFGVTWEGFLKVPRPGRYRFTFEVEDNYRFFLNGRLLAEQWTGGVLFTEETEVRLGEGLYGFKLDYYVSGELGRIFCFWEGPGFDIKRLRPEDFCRP